MLDIVHIDPNVAQSFLGRAQILSWRRVTIEALRGTHERAVRHHAGLGGEKIATLSVLGAPFEIPDPEIRQVASEITRATASMQVAAATVVEGGGFWGAAARAALAGVYLVASARMSHRVFATTDEGATCIGEALALRPNDIRELARAAKELRQKHLALPLEPTR